MTSAVTHLPQPLPTSLKVAGLLAWVWGILIALAGMVLFTLASRLPSGRRVGGEVTLVLACGLAYCVVGYGLRRASRFAIWLALGFSTLVSLGALLELLVAPRPALIAALIINQTLFWFVLVGFTRLVAIERSRVGA